ncbi:MAG: FAD-binding and (Fe-S)-binding domain-containing protein [Thermoleophilia bacterium]|nr:FAD-binding and (Fe-S)-binding domain-containing protein [Thermoleophilia bacterium]
MASLTASDKKFLAELFGERVSFDKTERKLYGHDIAAMPSMVRPVIGNTVPDAVVQPRSEEQLSALLRWANEQKVALTPRGKATSGYGGVIPVKNGVVVDFYFMKDIVKIDAEALTVTVQPGIGWEKLDRMLKREGLTLRLYPSSYPSSTVGGWLGQGGAGYGSYAYNYFPENVVSARAVLPGGEVRVFEGDDLDLLAAAEGTTGFVTEVTLKVMPLTDIAAMSVGCETGEALQGIVAAIHERRLPVWSVSFINPRMATLKNEAPLRTHQGHVVEDHVELPEQYILTLAYAADDREAVEAAIGEIILTADAQRLSDEIAEHEWEHRFKFMVVKRLGPSLVPSEVVVPLRELGATMAEIETVVKQPIVKEGVIVGTGPDGEPEAVILGFIPADERKFSYNLVFGLVLSIMKIAEQHGGRAYSTGLYFGGKADSVMGADVVRRLREFKQQVDPNGILNPNKVLDNGVTGTLMDFAGKFESQARALGNRVTLDIGERHGEDVKGIPGDVAWYAYSCSQCGYCVDQCDQFYGRGWESQSPRGKWYWLREYMAGDEQWTQEMISTFLACTTCEICDRRCSASLPIEPSWMKLRGQLIQDEKRMTLPAFEMMAAALTDQGNIWAGHRKDRADWFPEDMWEKHGPGHESKTVYFAGCTASYAEPDIGIAAVRLLDEAGVDFTYLAEKENCCATPMLVAGKWDVFIETMKKNIAAVKEAGGDTVVTSCPACDMMWRQVYPKWAEKEGIEFGITPRHYSEVVAEKLVSGEFKYPEKVEADGIRSERTNGEKKVRVAFHDSCHLGRASGVYEPPRELIKANPNAEYVELPYNREEAHCCGSVLTLLENPAAAANIGGARLEEAEMVGAEKILAACPCCQFQLRVSADAKGKTVEVVDLAHFCADALGYDLPDPNEDVQFLWSVFEGMIKLMTPQGFADLMKTMWPEVVDAMPMGMGGMMRKMAKVPGALEAMKPMFPTLFPRLLPQMMPALLPTMLERIKAIMPMPQSMEELMPELMPGVMDNLMPHMIADVVPLVTDDLIAYLKSEAGRNGNGKGNGKVRKDQVVPAAEQSEKELVGTRD